MPEPVINAPFRQALLALARRRVHDADAEDLVQQVLLEALAAKTRPEEPEELRKWIYGILRNKAVDHHRRTRREVLTDEPGDAGNGAAVGPIAGEADLLRWAMERLPPGVDQAKTLEWLLREGEGEKLEAIAEAENLPAPRVRQRVSRLRKHFREHWRAELGLLAALGIVAAIYVVASRKAPVSVLPDSPVLEAERLRNGAFGLCETGDPTRCIETLDRARALDPSGDGTQPVQNARKRARERLAPPIAPSASGATLPSAVPTPPVPTATVPKSKPVSTEAPRTTPAPDPKKFGGPTKGESSF
jgi:RNA polymerase sigma factor (sigma-70 family)